jgi:hypothetical protein
MVDKQSFYKCIDKDTVFNNEFYKKVYGYSICDKNFLGLVAKRLTEIDKKDKIKEYNEWYTSWYQVYMYGDENHSGMVEVSKWYKKECDKQFESLSKNVRPMIEKNGVSENWEQKKLELLLKKKKLLLMQKSKQLIGS